MMSTHLEERFSLLLELAAKPEYRLSARENLAEANGMLFALLHVDAITPIEYVGYHERVLRAKVAVSSAENERSKCLPRTYTSFDDGISAVQVPK